MKYSFDVKISEHIWEDTLGQLICLDAPIAREGFQEYYEDDIFKNGSFKIIKIERPWAEVLKSAPTFEAKPIVIQHPDKSIDITVKNMKEYKVGHVQNVRPSEYEGVKVLIADLVFDDAKAIEKVKSGELRELSCGYFYEIDTKELKQYDIKGEHLALVEEGRAGIAKIIDGKEEIFELHKYLTLSSKEEKDKFMSKISTEVLNGIKEYYNRNEEEAFSPEEIEFTIKIVDRELNNRNNKNMGLSEEAKKENESMEENKSQDAKDQSCIVLLNFRAESWNQPIEFYIADFKNGLGTALYKDKAKVFKNVKEAQSAIDQLLKEEPRYTYFEIIDSETNFLIKNGKLLGKKSQDDLLSGGLSDNITIRDLCLKHDVTEKFIRRQLQKGIQVEMEHTNDEDEAREIAMDHLYEMPNYYDKLSKMENENKGNDLYIEDEDKISMTFSEDEIAWSSIPVSEVVKGDIISTVKSIRPFEVQSIKQGEGEVDLYLISTDENFRKKMTLGLDEVVDILIMVETGKKVRFDSEKTDEAFAQDKQTRTKIKDLKPGDIIIVRGKEVAVTDIEEVDTDFYDVSYYSNVIFAGARGDVEVIKK